MMQNEDKEDGCLLLLLLLKEKIVKWRSSISGNDMGIVIGGLGDGDVLQVPV